MANCFRSNWMGIYNHFYSKCSLMRIQWILKCVCVVQLNLSNTDWDKAERDGHSDILTILNYRSL